MVFVFDFGLGERSLVMHAPVNGAQAFVDEAVFVKRKKCRQDHRLVLRVHGGVGPVPAAEDADALELLALQVEKLLGVLAACRAHIDGAHLQLLAAQFLVDLDLDGQAVAIPTGHVGRVESGHGLRLDDEIFQALVQRRPQVDRSAGIGRAVVQNVGAFSRPFAGLADAVVDSHLLPAGEHFGLVLGQVGLHWEGGFRQIDGSFQVERHSVGLSQMIESFHYTGIVAGNVHTRREWRYWRGEARATRLFTGTGG